MMESWRKWVIKIAKELLVCVFYVAAIIIAWLALRGCMTAMSVWPQGMTALILFVCAWAMAVAYGLVVVGNCYRKQVWRRDVGKS